MSDANTEEIDINTVLATLDKPLREFVELANKRIVEATTRAESAEKARDELEKEKESVETLTENDREELEDLRKNRAKLEADVEKARDEIERLIDFLPGDPGRHRPLPERVETFLKKANNERDAALAELASLKAAIIPELERLEGHEKRLRAIVDEFSGKVKGERLATLLREAKEAF